MSTNTVLTDFAAALLSGSIKIVDLTAPLGPDTPVIYLPPQIGKNTPAVKVHELSHYDQNGPFWAWNWLELGQNRLASAIGALEPIACVSIFLGYVGGAFARKTFGDVRMREETFEER